jgi:hypothetical protein
VQEPQTQSFIPTDDAFARDKKPNNKYGSSGDLRVRKASKQQVAFPKFNLEGLQGEVTSVKLLLLCNDGSNGGGTVHDASHDWSEEKLDWKNAPSVSGKTIASIGPVKAGETVELDITIAITGNGIYGFAIRNTSSDLLTYSSKEGAQSPELVITTSGTTTLARTTQHSEATQSTLNLPTELTLLPNYPNPFNQETTLTYSLPEAAEVELAIYNVRGRKVKALVQDYVPAGMQTFRWDGRNHYNQDVSSGVYLVRLRVLGRLLNQKIILLK